MSPALPRTLFVGRGTGSVCWYRCALPARALGADWVGVVGEPGALGVLTGELGHDIDEAAFSRYEVVVIQQPRGARWLQRIEELQAGGTRVLFEVDDYLHAVGQASDHAYRDLFDAEQLGELEDAMRAADGLICSTPFLAERYAEFNPRTSVCRNGIDAERFDYARVERPEVTIGWAGGTGHADAMRPALEAVAVVMERRPQTRFLSVGQPFGAALAKQFGPDRATSLAFTDLETYPAILSQFDIALAPAGRSDFFRAKSDLRWLEASALGIPVVADPHVYPDVRHNVTGMVATSPKDLRSALTRLVDHADQRARIGAQARAHVLEHRTMDAAARQWADVLAAVGSPVEAAA